jgi:RHS repeat-associated protein
MKSKTTLHTARVIFGLTPRVTVWLFARASRGLRWFLLAVMLTQGMGCPLAAAANWNVSNAGATARPGPAADGPKPNPSATAARAAQSVETLNVFGPRRFDRGAGAPATATVQFPLPDGAGAPFVLTVRNGATDGSARASSATVKLNGAEIFRPSDFNKNVAALERRVELRPANKLEVRLTSAPGSYITLTVTAARAESRPARLLSAEPARATQGQTLTVELRGDGTHWQAGQTRASFGGEVSVGGAPQGEPGPVSVMDSTTAFAEVVVSPTAALAPRNVRVVTPAQGDEEGVALTNAFTVVSVSAPGVAATRVSTPAGAAGSAGFADGAGALARFNNLVGVAAGPDDSIYLADAGNNRVRVVREQAGAGAVVSYVVSTLAGSGAPGFADGAGAQAQFNNPQGVAVGVDGAVYVADTDNHRVRRVGADGMVTTVAGDGTPGFVNGPGAQARFNAPRGVAVDDLGNVYVADTGNAAVRRIGADGVVQTLAGDGTAGDNDSPNARFKGVSGIACDGTNVFVYLADAGNHRVRRLDSSGTVITLAGAARGFADGSAAGARFAEPSGIALDATGKLVVADAVNSLVRLIDPQPAGGGSERDVTTLAGTGERGSTDGAGNVARFVTPRAVAVARSSAVFVADTGNNTLRRILLPPVVNALSPQRAHPAQQISILGERFDARAPERNAVRFTRSAQAGGGQTAARVLSATRTALTVEVPPDAAGGPVTVETEGGAATSPSDFELIPVAPPSITDFNPKRGPAGAAVNITGANLTADSNDPGVTFQGAGGLRLPALVTSASETEVRALVPNGAVTGKIELTHAGGRASSPSPFTVESEQDFQLTVAPSTATAVQGGTATYVVSLTSRQPSFSQLAKLSAEGLPAGVAAAFEPAQITAGASSTLSVALGSSGLAPGSYPFSVKAVADAEGRELSHATHATLNVMAGGQTTLSGRVLSTEDEPIMGAVVSLDGRTATTDAAGAFILSGVTAGRARPLMIDGRTASAPNRTYPVILEPADIVAGQANVVPYVYYLPPIDTQYEVQVVPGQNTAAGNPRVPGLQMMIPAGANLRNRDGSPVARVSITPLAIDRTPTPLPPGVKTNLVYTSQPGGALTDIAIPVVYPNLAGANPGARVELYAFDHDFVRWYVYGYGRVSADGRTIAPEIDPATGRPYGLRDFSWHFPNVGPDGNPEGDDKKKDCAESSTGDNPVNLATGMKIEGTTDISFGGARGGLGLTRVYTSDLAQSCDFCPFGRGTTHNYAVSLSGNFNAGGAGRVRMPDEVSGRLFSYAGTDSTGALLFTTRATSSQLGAVLRRLPAGTFEYRKEDGTVLSFDAGGKLVSVADRNGNTTTLSYSGANLTRVTDAVGRSIALDYDGSGRVTAATDPLGRVWRYTYEGTPGVAGGPGLTTVTEPLGRVWRYAYVTGGRLASVTDPRGNAVKRLTYDDAGRVIRQQFADGGVETYAYTLSGGLVTSVTVTDPLARKTTLRFNAAGYVVSSTDQLGQESSYARDLTTNLATSASGPCGCAEETRKYDSRGNTVEVTDRIGRTQRREYLPNFSLPTKLTDELGHTTALAYDSRGNVTTITDPRGQTTVATFDAYGQLTAFTDQLGHTTRTEYDARGNVSAVVDPLGNRTTFEHDEVGRETAKTDPLGRRTSTAYDALDRVVSTTDAAGAVTRFEYDANGNLTKITDALGRVWKYAYDARDRLVSMTDPLGRVLRRRLNLGGEVVTVTSPSGQTLRYAYDARGDVVAATSPLGDKASYIYDSRGNLTAVVDARGGTTTYAYDELYRLTGIRNPLGQTASATYNGLGQLVELTDEAGRRTAFTYDDLNRLSSVALPDATLDYSYDAANRPTRIGDSQGGAVEWGFDDAGRVVSETTPAGTVAYGYNAAGQRTSMRAADRAPVAYEYDEAGRLQTVRQGAEAFGYQYDPLSRLLGVSRPNSVTTAYGYDAVGRLERLRHADGAGQAIEDFRYAYTADDEIASVTSQFSATLLPPAQTNAPADAANRVAQSGETSYTFDRLGQTTSKADAPGVTQYEWDSRGRLTRATLPGGRAVSYGYDALDRLASRTADGATTQYLYDGLDVVLDRGSDGSAVEYLNGPGVDNKLRQSGAGGPLYFLQDHVGSTAALTNPAGGVVEAQRYAPFGQSTGSQLTRYGFNGRELDPATGLMHYRARWYDPSQGRFLSEDPLGFDGGLNFYAYAANDPVNFIDPLGLSASSFMRGVAEGATLSFVQGFVVSALMGILTCLTGGTIFAFLVPLLSLYMAVDGIKSLAETIESLLTQDLCPDELHYLIGSLIGGALVGKAANTLGARAGRFCFTAGTLVQTAEGERPIEEIKAGDVVLTADPERGGVPEWGKVTETFERTADGVLDVRAGGQTITATPEHPFWVEGEGWTAAADLRPGDELLASGGGRVAVESIGRREGRFRVYNFEVENSHTYFVSRLGLLVHNKCTGGSGPVKKGQQGVQKAIKEIEAKGGKILSEEVTMQTPKGRTRIDLYAQDAAGNKFFVEVKNGKYAGLTKNQKKAFPLIQGTGGTPRGPNAARAGFTPGVPTGPIPIMVIRY